MATSTARLITTLDDRELARLASAGNGDAFAVLYDRHERRVYGFALRLLGTEDAAADATQETFMRLLARLPALRGRDVNFIAYALTTTRNACYDALAARRRTEPVADTPEPTGAQPADVALDPERAALLGDTREQVRAAHAKLAPRQREVLALRELEQLPYERIGEVVGLNANAVAQLISRARIRLRELISGGQLESIAASSPECERALPLLAREQDAEPVDSEDTRWLGAHVSACETCRLRRAAMQEAGVSYRALGPIVPLLWLRHATFARAAELVGADWSAVAGPRAARRAGGRRAPWRSADPEKSMAAAVGAGAGAPVRRRHLGLAAAAALLLALVLAVVLAAAAGGPEHLHASSASRRVRSAALAAPPALAHRDVTRATHRAAEARQPSAPIVPVAATLTVPQRAPAKAHAPVTHHRHSGAGHRPAAHPRHHRAPPKKPSAKPTPTPTTTAPAATTPAPAPSSGSSTTPNAAPPAPVTPSGGTSPGSGSGSGSGTETGAGGCTLAIAC
jgi:RNA polymerase sigma-70 factor (ECF subfamily)